MASGGLRGRLPSLAELSHAPGRLDSDLKVTCLWLTNGDSASALMIRSIPPKRPIPLLSTSVPLGVSTRLRSDGEAVPAGEIGAMLTWPAIHEQVVEASKVVPDDIGQVITASGTPDECRAKVAEYVAAACTCPILYPVGPSIYAAGHGRPRH